MVGVTRLNGPTRKTTRMVCLVERFFDQFNEISNAAAAKQALENAADLNHEIANVDTGKNQRFLSPDHSERGDSEGKKAKRRIQSILDQMLLDAEYAAAYQSAGEALGQAETDAEDQIALAKDVLAASADELESLRGRAAELPDGTKVYLDAETGQLFTEDGRALSEEEASQIEFTGNEPTYADYLAAKQKMDDAQNHLNDWLENQVTLGGFRNEIENQDNPPSKQRLGEIEREIEERRPEMIEPKTAVEQANGLETNQTSLSTAVLKVQ